NHPHSVCRYFTGLAQLRAGNLQRAAFHFEEADFDRRWPSKGLNEAPHAIVLYRLGDLNRAAEKLRSSDDELDRWLQRLLDGDPLNGPWFDLLELLYFNELAHQEINGSVPDRRDSLNGIRTASLSLFEQ
ncbi:MAG: hypothetical protein AAFV88_18805, partial [Planctomycetota bacterium]